MPKIMFLFAVLYITLSPIFDSIIDETAFPGTMKLNLNKPGLIQLGPYLNSDIARVNRYQLPSGDR